MAFSTTSELASLTEKELGHNLSGSSSQRTDIVSHLDEAHKTVLAGGGVLNYAEDGRRLRNEVVFPFARSQNPKILTLIPAVTTASVTSTRNSASISFAADPNSGTSIANYFIRIKGEDEVYRVSAHTAAATTATLDGVYVGPSNVSAGTCDIFKLQYDIGSSDVLQLVSPFRVYSGNRFNQISLTDKDELVKQYPLHQIGAEMPNMAAAVKETTGTLTVQFNSYPSDYERVEVDYIPVPTTLDTSSSNPIIPAHFRKVLSYLAAYYMAVRNGDKRAGAFLGMARQLFGELVEWSEKLQSVGDPDMGRIVIGGFKRRPKMGVQKSFN